MSDFCLNSYCRRFCGKAWFFPYFIFENSVIGSLEVGFQLIVTFLWIVNDGPLASDLNRPPKRK